METRTEDSGDGQPAWQESNSRTFIDLGRILTPGRDEIQQAILDLVPAEQDESFLAVEIGTGSGWLSEALLRRFPAARVLGLDGSPTMLEQTELTLQPFAGRFELRRFRLEDPSWLADLRDVRCFFSCLVIHHLDGLGKQRLFHDLHDRLEPGGALLIADCLEATGEWERRFMARSWDEIVRRQSLEMAGNLDAYQYFLDEHWNYYLYPDPFDKPSPLPDQLRWLEEAGFAGVDAFWLQAGHGVYGGYTPGPTR